MTRISNREIIDVIKYTEDRIILVEKVPIIESTQFKVNYFIINLKNGEKEVITKSAYLLKKLGSAYQKISESLPDFALSQSCILKDKSVFIIFPNGECGLFNQNGNMEWNKKLEYNGSAVTSLASDGDYIWCVCRNENCVIRYDCETFRIDLRIGSKDAQTFEAPSFVSEDESFIYVCCANKLRAISKEDLTVSDVGGFIPNLKRFYRFGETTLICTTDGAYIE